MKHAALLLFLASATMYAESVTLTSVNGASQAGFYVSPYYLSIDGAAPLEAWCVDFQDAAFVGETWTVDIGSGGYFPSSDYPELFGIIQAELNDPSPNLVGYQLALWGVTDPAQFGTPSGVYLADESTPLTASFEVVDGIGCTVGAGCPQEFVVDSPAAPEPATWLFTALAGFAYFGFAVLVGKLLKGSRKL